MIQQIWHCDTLKCYSAFFDGNCRTLSALGWLVQKLSNTVDKKGYIVSIFEYKMDLLLLLEYLQTHRQIFRMFIRKGVYS